MSAQNREQALKISKWLLARERREEAMAVLCIAAASGPNDEEGQGVIAKAFEIVPDSPLAKAALSRMTGGADGVDQAPLEATLAKFTSEEIEKLAKEMNRPQFMRAQVGFNNNLKYNGVAFHVQTEDSGLKLPHIITHLFADGGRIIKSHKRMYTEHIDRPDVGPFVRGLMKSQHMEMVAMLRAGKFDEVIAGRARGGMDVLTHAPEVELQQMATRKKEGAAPDAPAPPPPPAPSIEPPRASAPVNFMLRVMRSTYGGPELYEPQGDEVIIGNKGSVRLDGEVFCHPKEALFRWKEEELFLEDLEGGNGVFIRIRRPVEIEAGDEFVVGDQLLRIDRNPERDLKPDPGPTYLWFSPCPVQSAFRVVQILRGGITGDVRMAGGSTLQIGKSEGDLLFPKDFRLSEKHCFIEEQAGVIVLTDLMSRTGVFVRIRGEQRLFHGDELLVGRTVLRVEIPKQAHSQA
ncbi:MAG: FHA domain-containing protein [Polyangiales bacterium]